MLDSKKYEGLCYSVHVIMKRQAYVGPGLLRSGGTQATHRRLLFWLPFGKHAVNGAHTAYLLADERDNSLDEQNKNSKLSSAGCGILALFLSETNCR